MLSYIAAFASVAGMIATRGAELQVTVGGPGILEFNPQSVTANPGDIVTFSFHQENHTVTQSTFQNPCQALDGGFDSGFVPVADNDAGPFPAAQFTVADTNPVWVFCRQTGHCEQGMVFAINPGDQFSAFQAAAMGLNSINSSSTSNSNSSDVASSTAAASQSSAAASVVTVTATVTAPASSSSASSASSAPSSSAQASPPPPAATSMSADHQVVVGGPNKLVFDPANITANIGDTITFQFMQKNHTATQSSFADPCVSLSESSTNGEIGFDSGFMPVSDNATSFPTFTIQINDTSPIWAFCRQTNPTSHCGAGMVFSVNAVEGGPNNFAAFQATAIQLNGTNSTTSVSSDNGSSGPQVDYARSVVAAITVVLSFVIV
ncbi:hypothetical protein CERSUDRAFT_117296 [Gelatoporia subvermispora B]|uniref:Phytocyanin domain-containing protein n=1 Tax=Ceriporiopsis subvermispora (strain B) TaxID=914234 RepID=M2R6Z4_CERS8|nr:hypothetical protein CERSUDRAFT_117296 [Gelatoporia subvermispora B]